MFALVLALVLLLFGILGIVAGILARLGRFPRHRLLAYGRGIVLTSHRAWRVGHRAAWIPIVLGGLIPAVAAIVILQDIDSSRTIGFAVAGLGIAVCSLVARAMAERAAERDQLARPTSAGQGNP